MITRSALVTPGRAVSRRLLAVAALAGALALSGCGVLGIGTGDELSTEPPPPAEQLYAEGLASLDAGRTGDAIKAFEDIDRYYPGSDYARRAMVMSGFASFESRDYDSAIDATERFLTLYPTHPDADYALFILGQSYLRQIPDVTRDQEAARRAMATMEELIARFPNSEYVPEAQTTLIAVRDQLAGQEMQVGRYYLERREYIAAINRFQTVVAIYQDTRHVEEALYRLTEANLAMGLLSEAQTAAAVLGHNFPGSSWYQRAFNLLAEVGAQPAENRNSDISQAFN
ncbi:MAG: outer membrane protein assembly factor BamD [Bauldia sp.]|nr:outer membrane protein assembly factor BamD [Bauldia sp.]